MTTAYRAWSIRRRGSSSDGKNDPCAQLRDRQVQIAGLRRQHPRAVTVAFGDPAVGAFVAAGADRRGGFDLDQLLQRPTGKLADQIDAIAACSAASRSDRADSARAIGVFSFGGFLPEHTKDHADGSPTGGPPNPHHARGLYHCGYLPGFG